MKIPNPYEWKNYRFLVLVPLLLMALSLVFIPQIPQGIDLKGGLLFTVYTSSDYDVAALRGAVGDEFGPDSVVRPFSNPAGKGFEIELPLDDKLTAAEYALLDLYALNKRLVDAEVNASAFNQTGSPELAQLRTVFFAKANEVLASCGAGAYSGSDSAQALQLAEEAFTQGKDAYRQKLVSVSSSFVTIDSSSFKEIGSSLSRFFFNKLQEVVVWAFVLSAAIVFIVFRKWAPSFIVIFGAVADIVITMGVMGVLGIPLSLASAAALLMLIGFSLDTDVMLTTRVLKHKEGTPPERAFYAMKTGLMMTTATMVSFGVLAVLALTLQIGVYYQIGMVALIGAAVDFIATWGANAPLIVWFVEREQKKSG